MMKRFLCMICVAVMMMCAVTVPACADGTTAYASTSISDCSEKQLSNIQLAIKALNNVVLEPGDEFSFNGMVGPRSVKYSYVKAIDGAGDNIQGGGVAQLASTIYLAIKNNMDYNVTMLYNYAKEDYSGSYVDSYEDAVYINYSDKKDFSFTNNTGYAVTLHLWIDKNSEELRCSITESASSSAKSLDVISGADTEIEGNNAKINNIKLASKALDGTIIESGKKFSFNDVVGARSSENGYKEARNGRGVTVYGGGVAQVATTLYLTVKGVDEIKITDMSTYGKAFNDNYVDDVKDAIVVDYSAGTDFGFKNVSDFNLQINMSVEDDMLVCTLSVIDKAVG